MGASTEFLACVHQLEEVFTNALGTFANESYKTRLTGLLRDCVALNNDNFTAEQSGRLLQLADEMENDACIQLPSQIDGQVTKSPMSAQWEKLLRGKGYSWQNSPWFHSEQYMFHLVLLLVDHYATGIDPFHISKVMELKEDTPWALLQVAAGLSSQEGPTPPSRHDQLRHFMKLCLWGNKDDGCYKEVKNTISSANASLAFDDKLILVDHSSEVILYMEKILQDKATEQVTLQFINDNCGTELLLDLALADHLLTHGWCNQVTFNVKMDPMYVSDATVSDVLEHITAMRHKIRSPEAAWANTFALTRW